MNAMPSRDSIVRALAHHERTRTIYLASEQPGAKPFKVVIEQLDEPIHLTVREAGAFALGVAAGLAATREDPR